MVKVDVRDLVAGADTVAQGIKVNEAIQSALAAHDQVIVSFASVGSASSSFVSACIIPVLRDLGFEVFKARVHISDTSWQIADVIKRRVAMEHA
jgi:hypothetical protein